MYSFFNMLRIFFIMSIAFFVYSSTMSSLELFAVFLINLGIMSIPILSIKYKYLTTDMAPNFRRRILKNGFFIFLTCAIIGSFFVETIQYRSLDHENGKNLSIRSFINNKYYFRFIKSNVKHNFRLSCVKKVKDEIENTFRNIIPAKSKVVLIDLPHHDDCDESIIW
jgi:hypothetical protein